MTFTPATDLPEIESRTEIPLSARAIVFRFVRADTRRGVTVTCDLSTGGPMARVRTIEMQQWRAVQALVRDGVQVESSGWTFRIVD